MSNYSKSLGTYLSKNKYVNNQRKKSRIWSNLGGIVGDWNMPPISTIWQPLMLFKSKIRPKPLARQPLPPPLPPMLHSTCQIPPQLSLLLYLIQQHLLWIMLMKSLAALSPPLHHWYFYFFISSSFQWQIQSLTQYQLFVQSDANIMFTFSQQNHYQFLNGFVDWFVDQLFSDQ